MTVNNSPTRCFKAYDDVLKIVKITSSLCDVDSSIKIYFKDRLALADNNIKTEIFELLNKLQIGYELKENIYNSICDADNVGFAICELQAMNLSEALLGAISEILFAQ